VAVDTLSRAQIDPVLRYTSSENEPYLIYRTDLKSETFEKCSILFKFKEGEDFNRRNTLSILRIEI
jgi:hypothetical protein